MSNSPAKKQKKPIKKGTKGERDEKGRFVEGHSIKGGRPVGTKSFSTIFEEALRKIAKATKTKEAQVEIDLVIKAIAKARGGDYKFYKDIFDRVYGLPKQKMEMGGELELKERVILTDEQLEQIIRRRAKKLDRGKGSEGNAD